MKASILLVEDDEHLRATIRHYAEERGMLVWETSDGLGALWIVQHQRPDLVLLDLNMPRLDGFETLRHIRAFDPSIEVVIITGDRNEETHARMTRLGLKFLLKPFQLADLDALFETPRPPG